MDWAKISVKLIMQARECHSRMDKDRMLWSVLECTEKCIGKWHQVG